MKKISQVLASVLTALVVSAAVLAQTGNGVARPPIIIIPGITGSELINGETGEVVWFKPRRSKSDDLRLPMTTNLVRNRDKLVVRDILRGVQVISFLPEVEIYAQLIDALEKRAGYVEGSWDAPGPRGFESTFYVFPYDWRRDNVENARLLVQRIEALKRKLGKPDLKFDIIAHSMGGLISRYAAMYGDADISGGKPKPTWAGAKHLGKVFMLGTPNEGSISAFDAMINGFSYLGRGVNIPFVQDLSRFDVLTLPSMFQLMPQNGALRIFDEDLKPLKIDLYDPKTWEDYGWSITDDPDFRKKFDIVEQEYAEPYFRVALARAKRFHAALNASGPTPPIKYYLLGANCKETREGAVLVRKKQRWRLIFSPESFEKENGEKVLAADVRKAIVAMGDGTVPQSSLRAANIGNARTFPVAGEVFQCESHTRLFSNPAIQDKLFALLFGDAAIK